MGKTRDLFKKIRDTKGIFHAKMSVIKDRNGMDLTVSHSVTQLCLTLCNHMNHSTPGLPDHHQLPGPPKPMSMKSVMPSNHPILCCPLLLPSFFQHQGLFK